MYICIFVHIYIYIYIYIYLSLSLSSLSLCPSSPSLFSPFLTFLSLSLFCLFLHTLSSFSFPSLFLPSFSLSLSPLLSLCFSHVTCATKIPSRIWKTMINRAYEGVLMRMGAWSLFVDATNASIVDLVYVAVCCSVLQCVAMCCSLLQCVDATNASIVDLVCVAVCCSVLQCVAVC